MAEESLDDALTADHVRLDGLLRRLEETASLADFEPFARGLSHHMAWEDGRLFPAVKAVADARERRSVESLEIDHERLRAELAALESALGAGRADAARAAVSWIRTLLQGHNHDEEHGAYEIADRRLDAATRRGLLDAFRA